MGITEQRGILIAMLCLVFLASHPWLPTRAQEGTADASVAEDHVEVATHVELTEDQEDLLNFALSRFEGQGLALPQISVDFSVDTLGCHGHKGLYWSSTRTVRMCSMDKKTMLHELAHAWADLNLTDDQRDQFTAQRGLEVWHNTEHNWEERATEHAAEIIAWALTDQPTHVRYVIETANGSRRVEYRLLTIDDSSVEKMCEAFVNLTNKQLVYRHAAECDSELLEIEWQARMATASSPEARGH